MRPDIHDDQISFRSDVQAASRLPLAKRTSNGGAGLSTATRNSTRSSVATTCAHVEAGGYSSDAAETQAFFDGVNRDHYEQ